jgi:hypothetical protein
VEEVKKLSGAADASLEQQLTLGLGQPAPDAVGLADGERMWPALGDYGALTAHLLGAHLALGAGPTALAVWMKEHGGIDASAKPVHLPIPDVCVGSG